MTPAQLLVAAQGPCFSTLVGLGPSLAAARVVVRAEAVWLSGMIRAAVATSNAGIMRRSLARRAVRMMFTVISSSGECRASVRSHRKALKQSPVLTIWPGLTAGYPGRYCTSVNDHRN